MGRRGRCWSTLVQLPIRPESGPVATRPRPFMAAAAAAQRKAAGGKGQEQHWHWQWPWMERRQQRQEQRMERFRRQRYRTTAVVIREHVPANLAQQRSLVTNMGNSNYSQLPIELNFNSSIGLQKAWRQWAVSAVIPNQRLEFFSHIRGERWERRGGDGHTSRDFHRTLHPPSPQTPWTGWTGRSSRCSRVDLFGSDHEMK